MPDRGKYNRKHRHGDPIGQNGGSQGTLASLSDPTEVASGKQLTRLARAMAKTELKPQISAYRRLIAELKKQQNFDLEGLDRLGDRTQADISQAASAYDTGAQSATNRTQAVGTLLANQLADQGQAAATEQQTAQTGTLGGLTEGLALQGAPQGGQAQAALADLVTQQQARQAAETQASGQFATSQQGSYGGLLEGMRTAGGLQASTTSQGVARDIASRIAETRLQSGQDIREARGKKADVKALKGATVLEKLAQLRSEERDFILGKRATKNTKRGQDIQAATAAAAQAAQTARQDDQQAATAANQEDAQAFDASHAGDTPDNNGPAGQHDRKVERKAIVNLAKDFVDQYGLPADRNHPEKSYLKLKQYLLSQEGISNPQLVDRVLKDLLKRLGNRGGGSGGGGTAGNTPGPT